MNFNQNAAVEGGASRGSSFKAHWVWIVLKMGQGEGVEREEEGGRSSSIKSPLSASSVYLSSDRGLMLRVREDNPF